jgi:hypothetical protein
MFCIFLFILCLPTPPPVVPDGLTPDGQGGAASFYNSRVMPNGELRPYSPQLDGILTADGRVVPYLPPYPAPPYEPQGRVDIIGRVAMPARMLTSLQARRLAMTRTARPSPQRRQTARPSRRSPRARRRRGGASHTNPTMRGVYDENRR